MPTPGKSSSAQPVPDLGPDTYSRWRAKPLGRITDELQRRLIMGLVGNVADLAVLDVGCGDGSLAVALAQRGASVAAVDVSPVMIEAARQRASEAAVRVDLHVAGAHELPFADASFDVVVAVTMLCFVADARPVYREIARVLKPGGRLIIGELGRWSTWAAERRVRAWLGSSMWKRGRFRTATELQSLARGVGLVPGKVTGATFYPRAAWAARAMQGLDPAFGRTTTFGAAFLALEARKPHARSDAG